MGIKRCSKCGSDTIMAKVIYGATVQSLEDGTFKIVQQGKKFEVEPVQCMRCKTAFNNGINDLIEMQICKTCGKPSLDIDTNGECDICRALKTRPELANLSQNDLLRMYLQLEKQATSMPQAVQLVVNKAEEGTSTSVEPMNPPVNDSEEKEVVSNTAAEKVAAAQQAIAQAQAGEPVEEAPTTKKRKVTKKSTKVNETSSEEDTTTSDISVTEEKTTTETPLNDVDPFSASTTDFNMINTEATVENPVPDMPMPMFEEEQAY